MKYGDTVEAVTGIMAQYDVQLTLRQVYYRLVAGGLMPNARSSYNQLSSQLVTARENGDIDENRIADRSRRIDDVSFDSAKAYVDYCQALLKANYVRRFWDSQPLYCEVWVEKDALSQVLADAVYPFNTIVAPSRGYSSYSYLRDASARISRYCAEGKPTVILHFADHDPSGLDMTRDLQKRLAKFRMGPAMRGTLDPSGAGMGLDSGHSLEPYANVEVRRVALTFDQVQHYRLIPNPAKMADTRANGYVGRFGAECWELDAIPPDELVRLCRQAVESLITDTAAWQAIEEQDKADRRMILREMESLSRCGPEVDGSRATVETKDNTDELDLHNDVVD